MNCTEVPVLHMQHAGMNNACVRAGPVEVVWSTMHDLRQKLRVVEVQYKSYIVVCMPYIYIIYWVAHHSAKMFAPKQVRD